MNVSIERGIIAATCVFFHFTLVLISCILFISSINQMAELETRLFIGDRGEVMLRDKFGELDVSSWAETGGFPDCF